MGAITMGAGAAQMEEFVVGERFGFLVGHDLSGYEAPVHTDIPNQDVIFLDIRDS